MRAALLSLLLVGCARPQPGPKPLNVLFIAVDDLRPLLGAYGSRIARTPNLDSLAQRGALFEHAYCQQALCNPSRSSLMTGKRPDTLRVYDLETNFRVTARGVVTLPEDFKRHGYYTAGLGKIFHDGMDDARSWSAAPWWPRAPRYAGGEPEGFGPSWQAAQVADDSLRDGETAAQAVRRLAQVRDRPFFLAVGFSKPHLPFVAPQHYYDLYPPDSIALADNPFPPSETPPVALGDSQELRAYSDIPKSGPIGDDKARELTRGYYASVSYLDAQIGRVLRALDDNGLRERTIIVVWGDHGFHLGEHGLWCKATNFEVAARAPLIVAAPGFKPARIDALVEFVDIYPSLCALAGLPVPPDGDGVSFAPLLANPARAWKKATFTQAVHGEWMGRSARTRRYRYTEWTKPGDAHVQRELYDHERDPAENVNLAEQPEEGAAVAEMSRVLHDGWRAALPP